MFIDKININIKSGDGGNGCVSFYSAKYVPCGGPDGGDGGKGGDIIFVASLSLNTLNEYYYRRRFVADNGDKGGLAKCFGKQGADLVLSVPVGTIIKDSETGSIIADMFYDGMKAVVLHGGRGGKGNYHFATSRRQSPHFAQHGEKTIERTVTLELKTIADVGLVGFPNVGKSTMLSVISNARPKIANYHFTTLSPNLGMVTHYDNTFVVADIPGLIEGAAQGEGLGQEFLRHIERTRILIHIVDISGSEGRNPIEDFEIINNELFEYAPKLQTKPMIVVANKMDLENSTANLALFKKKYGRKFKIYETTTIIHEGIKGLLDEIVKQLSTIEKLSPLEFEPFVYELPNNEYFEVIIHDENIFEVTGGLVDDLIRKITLDNEDSFRYFQKILRSRGVIKELIAKGMKEGDTVIVGDVEFEYIE